MKYGTLIWSLVKRYKLLNVIYIVELALAITFSVIVANVWQQTNFFWTCVREFPQKGIVYNRNDLYEQLHSQEEAQELLFGFEGYLGYAHTDASKIGKDGEGVEYQIISSDLYTSDLLRILTKRGIWFTDIPAGSVPDGAVPCVLMDTMANRYRVGDSFSLSIEEGPNRKKSVTFYVTGIINAHERFYMFSSRGEIIKNYLDETIQSFYYTGLSAGNGLLCGPLPDSSVAVMPVTSILYFDASVSDEKLATYADKLNKVGCTQVLNVEKPEEGGDTVEEKTWMLAKKALTNYMAYFILFITFLTFCFISVAVYNSKVLLQRFSVYHLLGMTKRGLLILYSGYLLLLDLVAVLPAVGILGYLSGQAEAVGDYTYYLSKIGMSAATVIVLVYSLILLVPFAFQLRGYAPMEILNRE